MKDKLELKSSHEVVYTIYVADVNSIFYCKPTDPDILTVLMKDGKRLYRDEVCPVDSMQEESVSIDFEQELYKAFGQVKDFTLGMQIAKWFYDMGKNSQEPVSEDLEEAAYKFVMDNFGNPKEPLYKFEQRCFKAGAKWQKKQDQSTIELAEDHAMLAGMEKMKEQMMAKAVDGKVIANGMGNLILHLWDKGRHLIGKKVKVIIIKEE